MTSNSVPVRNRDVSHEQGRVTLAQTKDWELFWDMDHQVVGMLYAGWNRAAGVSASGFVRQLRALDLHEQPTIYITNPTGGTSRVNTADMRRAHRQALLPLLDLGVELGDLPMDEQIHLSQVEEEMEQLAGLGLYGEASSSPQIDKRGTTPQEGWK